MRWIAIATLLVGCNSLLGGQDLRRSDANVSSDSDIIVIDGRTIDAFIPASCTPGNTQCTNCMDDDGDGAADSLDIECTMQSDSDEATFGTGIPGDNLDPSRQDCFYDGNSGAGDDGCSIHVCCILGAPTQASCPIAPGQYNPADCPPPIGTVQLPATCVNFCGSRTPPGCDCFGCCTVCDPTTNSCTDIATHPLTSPGCTGGTLADPNLCKRCTKIPSCGRPTCGAPTCILCPGQTVASLPASCGGVPTCQTGTASCMRDADCGTGTYCDLSSRCCIGGAMP